MSEAESTEQASRFHSWRGFLAASVAVNLLFIYGMAGGMAGGMADPNAAIWYKTLIWLPFNAIASAVYLAIMARLPGVFYRLICAAMIVLDWSLLLAF